MQLPDIGRWHPTTGVSVCVRHFCQCLIGNRCCDMEKPETRSVWQTSVWSRSSVFAVRSTLRSRHRSNQGQSSGGCQHADCSNIASRNNAHHGIRGRLWFCQFHFHNRHSVLRRRFDRWCHLLRHRIFQISAKQLLTTAPEYHRSKWLPQCAYFAAFSFPASWTLKISLVVLEFLPILEAEVTCFAAALETGCLILLLAKSTDKTFQPELSVILAQHSWKAGVQLRRNRYVLVGSGCEIFMLVTVVSGKSILEMYGGEFVPGYYRKLIY